MTFQAHPLSGKHGNRSSPLNSTLFSEELFQIIRTK